MKIAVLISGEYRTFDMCRPTMTFLDDERVDIYLSTWDKSYAKQTLINLDTVEEIVEDRIVKILNKQSSIMIEPEECITEKKYSSKMIHRWLAGFEMIKTSGIEYDYVLVIRPDLFFYSNHPNMFTVDTLISDGDKQFAWYENGHKLQDNMFFGKYDTVNELFSRLSIKDWEDSEEGDWHTWWTDFVNWDNVKRLGGQVPFTFCRSIAKSDMNFSEVYQCEQDWRDMRMIYLISLGDRMGMVNAWGEDQVKRAENKNATNAFSKYKIPNRLAILITGDYRTFAGCRQSMKFLDNPNIDVFFSVWQKSLIRNENMGIDISQEITVNKIVSDLGFEPAGILIDENSDHGEKYNSAFIKRFTNGIKLISDKGFNPEYVLVVRPDLYFNNANVDTKTIIQDASKFDFCSSLSNDINKGELGDVCFISTFNSLKLITEDLYKSWQLTKEHNWHIFWYSHVKNFCTKISNTARYIDDSVVNRIFFNGGTIGQIKTYAKLWSMSYSSKNTEQNTNTQKICIVISGMLRNYEAAVLSLPIWGEHDRYLCTWASSGDEHIQKYKQLANTKAEYIIDDNEFESVYRDPYNYNPLRMAYLWKRAFENIPAKYDKYILIRPDGFYWTENPSLIQQLVNENTFCVNQTLYEDTHGLNDHIFIVSKNKKHIMLRAHADMLQTAIKFTKEGLERCVHRMLWDMWKNIPNVCCSELDYLVDTLFVRDSFKLRTKSNYDWPVIEDEYNYKLYKAIFYDSASWWRRWCGGDYEGILRLPNYTTFKS